MNVRLEESSFRILITALCRFGKVGYAVEILNFMRRDGCDVVDMRICSLILSSMCEQKKGLGSGDLNGIIKEGEYEKADELFDELLVLGLVPDVHTYNVYINEYPLHKTIFYHHNVYFLIFYKH